MQNSFLLYGANGYTGELIARYAAEYDLLPILAGRREEVLKPLAAKLNYSYKIFDVNDSIALVAALKEVKLIVNAAGPFQFTAKPIIEGCLQTGTHYTDVNGDISVFEFIKQYDDATKHAGIMLLPGAGFDVVPTDCTALLLKKLLPDAVTLKLAFANIGGGLSPGTATTTVNKLGQGEAVRKNGKIVCVPLGNKAMSLVWGQVSNSRGETKTVRMSCPDGYTLTMHSTLLIAQKILQGNIKPGYQTPASVYGEDLIMELPNVKREIVE